MRQQLADAQEARAVRLTELRQAAAQVAVIGEYYKLRSRSTRATYGGILCTLSRQRGNNRRPYVAPT
jgi:hypothetical protein